MRNANSQQGRGQQGENEWQWKNKSEHEHFCNKIFGEHIRQFHHNIICNQEVSGSSSAKQRKGNVPKSVLL